MDAHNGLVLEDFEESTIADGAIITIEEPLDFESNVAGIIAPGDIAEGLSIGTVAKQPGQRLVVVGSQFPSLGNPSVMVGANFSHEDLSIEITQPNIYTIGMDLMVDVADDVMVLLYGPNRRLLGSRIISLSLTPTFFGIHSKIPIGRVEMRKSDRYEFVDNILFGGELSGMKFFTSLNDFNLAASGLKEEDFLEAQAPSPPEAPLSCDQPITEDTDNSCFAPGDIRSGMSLGVFEGSSCPDCIRIYGPDTMCENSGNLILTNMDNFDISFNPPISYAGFNMLSSEISVYIYDKEGELLGVNSTDRGGCENVFWGVYSQKKVARIVLGKIPFSVYLQGIMYGNSFPWSVYMPTFTRTK